MHEPNTGAYPNGGNETAGDPHELGDAEDARGQTVRVVATRHVWSRFVTVDTGDGADGAWREKNRAGELLHRARQIIRRMTPQRTGGYRMNIHAADRVGSGRSRVHTLVITLEAATAYAPGTATVGADDGI